VPDEPLHYLTIAEASSLIRTGKLSPVELAVAHLSRIEALNSHLHAFITVMRETVLAEARAVESEIRAGRYRGPLHGIPIAHKDIVATQGVRTTGHSRLLMDWIPTENATVFERLRDAGAVCLGKTALHELAYGSPGADQAFPAAINPWNLDYAPGSSSSGSGAAVAAGLCMGATGTDTGGSIRHPASVCGIVGLKPTFGRVSVRGVVPLAASLDHIGPMTRCVRDNALMLQVMAGHDPRDRTSADRAVPDYLQGIDSPVRGMRVGVPRRFIEANPHSAEVLDSFAAALNLMHEMGAEILDIEVKGLGAAVDATVVVLVCEAYRYHEANLTAHPEKFGAPFKERVLKARQYTDRDYEDGIKQGRRLRATYSRLFQSGIDLIVSPGRETPGTTMKELLSNPAARGVTNRMYNITGLPALTLPMGFSTAGVPIGLQIAGNHFDEARVYQFAGAYEEAAGWYRRHPPL
jgi:aspartyl-tRNA(Asn)/glutamyl-tRNA(Gln) amidotransferase subunit A